VNTTTRLPFPPVGKEKLVQLYIKNSLGGIDKYEQATFLKTVDKQCAAA
jgi:hypothetical protein